MTEGTGVFIWGFDGTTPTRVMVDSSGHLQVDTISSALPSGAATSAKQDTIIGHIDGLETLLAGGLPAALDTGSLKVREQGTPTVLARAYDSAGNAINSKLMTFLSYDPSGEYGLSTISKIALYRTATSSYAWASASAFGDSLSGSATGAVALWAFNGSAFSRLRAKTPSDSYSNPSYALETMAFLMGWDSGNSHWERIKISAAGSIMTKEEASEPYTSGMITSSALLRTGLTHIYGITISTVGGSDTEVKLYNNTSASGSPKWGTKINKDDTFEHSFRPWIECDTGLYCEISGPPHSVVVEYGG